MSAFDRLEFDLRAQRLMEVGFVNIGRGVLLSDEVDSLSKAVRRAFDKAQALGANEAADLIESRDGLGLRGLPEKDPEIARLIDKVLSHGDVKRILSQMLGTSYKIWQIEFRRSFPGDPGLCLHEDARGQVNMCLLLSDYLSKDGATVFVPRSHVFPQRLRDRFLELPPYLFGLIGWFLAPLLGERGDVCFFVNRNWHGRLPNKSRSERDVILIAFFPAGATFGYDGYHRWSEKFLKDINGTELHRLLDPALGTEAEPSERYRVVGVKSETECFSIHIEHSGTPRVSKALLAILMVVRHLRNTVHLMKKLR